MIVDLIVGSPPFMESLATNVHTIGFKEITGNMHRKPGKTSPAEIKQSYGQTPGQLGGMKEGQFNPGDTMNKEKTRECVFDEWNGLYSEGWQGVIVEDAFAH